MTAAYSSRLYKFYEKHETRLDILFFLGGFFFDVLTLSDIDDILGVTQQLVYLFLLGLILFYDFLDTNHLIQVPPRVQKVWQYRQPALHFLLGSLLSLYSLFFLKSASLFSSIIFVLVLVGIMIGNELPAIRKKGLDIKIALFVVCVFSFFSIIVPVALGFVGYFPFLLSVLLTAGVLWGIYKLLLKKTLAPKTLHRHLVAPGAATLTLFVIFYFFGLIPPVPLSIQKVGIYHNIEKAPGQYIVSHQNSGWSFWKNEGDKDFIAEPGDKIFFFAQIFSPARFSDSVILHWYYKTPKGWQSTDKIPMRIAGGRKEGYRGFSMKQNYSAGEWRISVETTDGREIGRIYFDVTQVPTNDPTRTFVQEIF